MPQNVSDSQAFTSDLSHAVDAAAAYQENLAEARGVVKPAPYRLVPDLVLANIKNAERYVAARRDDIQEHFPRVNIAHFDGIGRLALGVKFAAMVAEGSGPSESEVSVVLGEARELRGKLLPAVGALAASGLVPQATYERIARGRGTRDVAEDCVGLAQVFREGGAALDGKHPVTPDQIERAALVGSWLLQQLRPAEARAEKAPKPEAVEIRNQMATLLSERYAKLQAVAHYFEGDGWLEAVPPLMTRPAPRREAAKAPEAPAQEPPSVN
ncbi:MAG TPA: hypothetical protein VLS89_01910 [Candidatus Nanopelagicales bacterium]|nr:hypothetical protein [Candidatus Nanopelagicales bacterium]